MKLSGRALKWKDGRETDVFIYGNGRNGRTDGRRLREFDCVFSSQSVVSEKWWKTRWKISMCM